MSTTYMLVCDDCRVRVDMGQSGEALGADPRYSAGMYIYNQEEVEAFFYRHLEHRLRVLVTEGVSDAVLDYTLFER